MTKVGVIGPVSPDTFADNLVSTLASMKIDAVSLGTASMHPKNRVLGAVLQLATKVSAIDAGLQSNILRRAYIERPDLILSVDSSLLPITVRRLQKLGAQVALWFPDHIANLGRQLMFMAGYDAIFFKEPRLVERLGPVLDLPIAYLPEACNPLWHYPPPGDERTDTVLIAGNMYPFRVRILERLARAGVPLQLYGPPWPSWLRSRELLVYSEHKYIARHDKAKAFRSAGVVLNTMHPSELDGVNCRLFEAAGCGASVLTEWRPEVERFFDVGRELLVFRTFDELVDQIRLLLGDNDRSRSMGDLASRRALRDHTYRHRLLVALNYLGYQHGR